MQNNVVKWTLPFEVTYKVFDQLQTYSDRLKFMCVSKFFWFSSQAWMSNKVLQLRTGDIRSLSFKNQTRFSLFYVVVGCIDIEYEELAKPISNVEIIRLLKPFKNLKQVTFGELVVLEKNVAGIQQFLKKRFPKISVTFENIHGSKSVLQDTPRSICHTSPVHDSFSNVLKRSVDQLYATPTDFNYDNESSRYWKKQKIAAIEEGRCRIRNHPIYTLVKLPPSLDKFVMANTPYYILSDQFDATSLLMNGTYSDDILDEGIVNQAKKLVEAVLLSVSHWVLVLHFDIFVANDKATDDCGHRRVIDSLRSIPKVKILECRDFGQPYYQLVVRWGQLEILVIGGYYGKRGDARKIAFSGSSLPRSMAKELMKNDGFAVVVPFGGVPYVRSPRFLRDYSKKHASRTWSLESERFAAGGFRICHPLSYDRHFSRQNAKYSNIGDICSLLLLIVCHKIYTIEHQQKALGLLLNNSDVKSAIDSDKNTKSHTLKTINKAVERKATSKKNLVMVTKIFTRLEQVLGRQREVNVTSIVQDISKDAAFLYNHTLVGLLVEANGKMLDKIKKT